VTRGLSRFFRMSSSRSEPTPVALAPGHMRLSVVGCGNAFGAGGRLQTCFHVETHSGKYLLDCGATALTGMERLGYDPNAVGAIFITHLHGDHFGGLVWWLMHAHYLAGRTQPLTVAGPAGIRERVRETAEALFPGSSQMPFKFELTYREFEPLVPVTVGDVSVTPFEVKHPSGATPYALRIACGERAISFSGDTEWVDSLLPCSDGADLFIVDCHGFDSDVGYHMSWKTIAQKLPLITARRVMLTHMGPLMLEKRSEVKSGRIILAEDGLVVDLSPAKVVQRPPS
jgi:ribonuclease BN (tRNA processing enzyme)